MFYTCIWMQVGDFFDLRRACSFDLYGIKPRGGWVPKKKLKKNRQNPKEITTKQNKTKSPKTETKLCSSVCVQYNVSHSISVRLFVICTLIISVLGLLVLFLFLLVTRCKSENNCNLVRNEVNTWTPANLKNNDFIELKMLCENSEDLNYSSLQSTKIIGISVP